ncbi:MAG: FAD:protein FMN transferase [Planctomycetes bacterium]|nr:FAD:protein FMN transferase [Planctomycetota bacterium]
MSGRAARLTALGLVLGSCHGALAAQAAPPARTVSPTDPETALRHADAAAIPLGLARHRFVEPRFGGIPVELTLYASDADAARAAARAAFARIDALAAQMDDYALDPPSALNRIAEAAPDAVPVAPELLVVLARAKALHRETHGAFDVTAKPFVQLWRVSQRLGELPPPERLRRAADFVDIDALELDPSAGTARLARPGMWLDLGGIAKGYIGDEVVRLLRARGVPICRYHAGGDMVFGESPPGLPGWPVHVPDLVLDQVPEGGEHATPTALAFFAADSAASVSGDVFRHAEIEGKRYAHVIDPRSGLGVTEQRITCVRGPRGIDTDPLATAGLILAPGEWQRAIETVEGCRGVAARRAGDGATRSPPPTGERPVAGR